MRKRPWPALDTLTRDLATPSIERLHPCPIVVGHALRAPRCPRRRADVACRKQPVSCREHDIAAFYGLTPNKNKPWQFEGHCPSCGHGGFSVTAPDHTPGPNQLRHIWWCNCHRCHCDPAAVRKAMITDGISEDCLGPWKRGSRPHAAQDEAGMLRAALREVLADPEIRALADLKIRVLSVIEGAVPEDWAGFIAFAERAGVPKSKRYEAAARWGRRQHQ